MQIYSRMGYIIIDREGEDDYIRMVNPEGMIEIVACQQMAAPAEIRNIHRLQQEMNKAKAVRGYFWSQKGFTSEAAHWSRHRPIILADRDEIGRLVECAREKGSSLLEY
jgi:hypothetical protein